jgi:hypothetical protein
MQTTGMSILNYPRPMDDFSMVGSLTGGSLSSAAALEVMGIEQKKRGNVDLTRTNSKLLTQSDAPIAVGRSGIRPEKGIKASGLLGERYTDAPEPTNNSFMQRSWLPYDDPALVYKRDGAPVAFMPNDVSPPIGEGPSETDRFHGNFRRSAKITGSAAYSFTI